MENELLRKIIWDKKKEIEMLKKETGEVETEIRGWTQYFH